MTTTTMNKKALAFDLVVAFLTISCLFYCQFKLQSVLPGRYIFIYPAVFFISWTLGLIPAIMAIIYCSLLTLSLYSSDPLSPSTHDLIKLATFTFSSLFITWIIHHSRRNENILKGHLKKNADELYSVLEGMKDAFVALDRSWQIVLVNSSFEQFTKTLKEQCIGKNIWDLYPELAHDQSRFFVEAHKVMSTGHPSEYEEYSSFLKIWTEVRIFPKGNGITIFFKNIEKRKLTENALLQSERHFKQLADSIPHIIWTANAQGEEDFYNARFYDYTGTKRSEEILRNWERIIHPDDYKRTLETWAESIVSKSSFNIEYRLFDHTAQNYRWFLGLAVPVKDRKGEVIKWFGSCTDIEDQKVLSEKMENYNIELQSALEARDEFLSIASHELKTPLTSLKLHTQHFKRGVEKNLPDAYSRPRIESLTTQVDKQIFKLNRLVDDMLDISRIRTGQLTLKYEEFYFGELVDEIYDILKNHFISANSPLPLIENDCRDIKVKWDKIRIEQVILNLFTNAIRYGEGRQIKFLGHCQNGIITFSVIDNGIGIAEENIDKIFNRFEKIRNPKEISGLGLGLFISEQIITAHQGKISVQSKLGKGSIFKVELPQAIF